MAKLYWRIKKNGTWTWDPAVIESTTEIYQHDQCECEICTHLNKEAVE